MSPCFYGYHSWRELFSLSVCLSVCVCTFPVVVCASDSVYLLSLCLSVCLSLHVCWVSVCCRLYVCVYTCMWWQFFLVACFKYLVQVSWYMSMYWMALCARACVCVCMCVCDSTYTRTCSKKLYCHWVSHGYFDKTNTKPNYKNKFVN